MNHIQTVDAQLATTLVRQLSVADRQHFVIVQEANPARTQLLGPTRNELSVPIANLLKAAQLYTVPVVSRTIHIRCQQTPSRAASSVDAAVWPASAPWAATTQKQALCA